MCLLVLGAWMWFRDSLSPGREILAQVEGRGTDTMGAGEWLPVHLRMELLNTPLVAYGEGGDSVEGLKVNYGSVYRFTPGENSSYYDVPFIYYSGYRAVTEEGEELTTSLSDETGLLRVFLPQGMDTPTEISVWYAGTRVMRYAYMLSVCGIFCCIMIVWLWKKEQ